MWTIKSLVVITSQRIDYESDKILVHYWFLDYPNGTRAAGFDNDVFGKLESGKNGININTIGFLEMN